MDFWKHAKCGDCKFKDEAPGSRNPANLSAPPIYICRHNPPQVIYAMAPSRVAGGPPQPVPLGSMYPLIDVTQIACSYHEKERKLPNEFTFSDGGSGVNDPKVKPM